MKDKNTILIIDDEESNIQLVAEILDDLYNILVCNNPLDGFKIIEKNIPDIIILDIKMPQMNGFSFSQKLKESEKTKDIPILFFSSLSDKENIEKGLSLGAYDYITKPFSKDELLNSIDMHIKINKKERSLFIKDFFIQSSILIVEDNSCIYKTFHNYFEKMFADVFYTSSFPSAIEMISRYKPQIILIDNHAQNINVPELVMKINLIDNNIITVILSEILSLDFVLDFMRIGAKDILKKPVSSIDIKSALLRYERIINHKDEKKENLENFSSIHEIRNLFSNLIEKHNSKITLINNYKGIPLIKDGDILEILAKEISIRVDKLQLHLIELTKSTVFSSIYFTKNIYAKLKEIDYERNIAIFDNFLFLDSYIQNRKNIRVIPDNTFHMYLNFQKMRKCCEVMDISNNYAFVKLKSIPEEFKKDFHLETEVYFTLIDTSRTKLSKAQHLKSKISFLNKVFNDKSAALIYFEFEDECQLIFNKYIYQRGIHLVMELKKNIE